MAVYLLLGVVFGSLWWFHSSEERRMRQKARTVVLQKGAYLALLNFRTNTVDLISPHISNDAPLERTPSLPTRR